ncbi:MAG: protein disulfide-isomerase [Chitinophagales bacterium]|jgi:protein disulfide-isomerase
MKNLLYIGLALFTLTAVNVSYASENPSEEIEKIAEAEEIRMNGEWFLYLEDAFAESKESGKPIIANFTGSDWCGWCIRLKNEVFKTETFQKWAKKNVVLLELDYPRKKQLPEDLKAQNTSLQQAFQVSGYPTLWLFNLDFDEESKQFKIDAIGKTGYVSGGADAWIGQTNLILESKKKK